MEERKRMFRKILSISLIFCGSLKPRIALCVSSVFIFLVVFQNCSNPLYMKQIISQNSNSIITNNNNSSECSDNNELNISDNNNTDNESERPHDSWKHFFGISWVGNPSDHIKYAKQMGHDYIVLNFNSAARTQYLNDPNRTGLCFYILNPTALNDIVPVVGTLTIDTTKKYTQEQIAFYEKYMIWKSRDSFPNNIVTSWYLTPTTFKTTWDIQQQVVMDYVIDQIIKLAKSYENQNIGFNFAGVMYDVPSLAGHFTYWNGSKNAYVYLPYWTGSDSSLLHGSITHEYTTYTEAHAALLKQINKRLRQIWPNMKWIVEPYHIYANNGAVSEWIYQIKDRPDKEELKSDLILQESSSTEFVDDQRIFNSGLNITRDIVGITQPNSAGEAENRLYAGKAGVNGSWYNWFGRYGGTGDMPAFQNISEVYPRLKLIRCVPNWDNLARVPLDKRMWNGSIYQSSRSFISSDIIYSRHWKTEKLFAVFLTENGVIKLQPGESVVSVKRTDSYFIESTDGISDINISGTEIKLRSSIGLNNGYIFTILSPEGHSKNL